MRLRTIAFLLFLSPWAYSQEFYEDRGVREVFSNDGYTLNKYGKSGLSENTDVGLEDSATKAYRDAYALDDDGWLRAVHKGVKEKIGSAVRNNALLNRYYKNTDRYFEIRKALVQSLYMVDGKEDQSRIGKYYNYPLQKAFLSGLKHNIALEKKISFQGFDTPFESSMIVSGVEYRFSMLSSNIEEYHGLASMGAEDKYSFYSEVQDLFYQQALANAMTNYIELERYKTDFKKWNEAYFEGVLNQKFCQIQPPKSRFNADSVPQEGKARQICENVSYHVIKRMKVREKIPLDKAIEIVNENINRMNRTLTAMKNSRETPDIDSKIYQDYLAAYFVASSHGPGVILIEDKIKKYVHPVYDPSQVVNSAGHQTFDGNNVAQRALFQEGLAKGQHRIRLAMDKLTKSFAQSERDRSDLFKAGGVVPSAVDLGLLYRLEDIHELVKYQTNAVAQVVLRHPQLVYLVVDSIEANYRKDKNKKLVEDIVMWGMLVVSFALILSGVGTAAGAWLMQGALMATRLVAIGKVCATVGLYVGLADMGTSLYLMAQRTGELSRYEDAIFTGNLKNSKAVTDAYQKYREARMAAILATGGSILDAGPLMKILAKLEKTSQVARTDQQVVDAIREELSNLGKVNPSNDILKETLYFKNVFNEDVSLSEIEQALSSRSPEDWVMAWSGRAQYVQDSAMDVLKHAFGSNGVSGYWIKVNDFLRNIGTFTPTQRQLMKLETDGLISVLTKISLFQGKTFRLGSFPAEVYDQFKVLRMGDVWSDPGIVATTKSKEILGDVVSDGILSSYGNQQKVYFEISGKTGRNISEMSRMAERAQEVIFLPSTKFKVVSVTPATRSKPLTIVLEEI